MERLDQVDYIIAKYYVASGSFKRKFYVVLGSLFVVFAIIGIWIPGWPTVSWAVPAASKGQSQKLGPGLFSFSFQLKL